jgi:sugar lactone lactonase YvrE
MSSSLAAVTSTSPTRCAGDLPDPRRGARHRIVGGRRRADSSDRATLPADSYTQGFNANGIVATPDGRALLVVYTNSGALYRVDLRTGTTAVVQLDRPLLNGDGLELRGHTLYVARNVDNLITTVRLSGDYTAGATIAERSYPGADVPTTLALSRGRLLVVNSQFDTLFFGAPQTSETFTISSIPLR